MEVKKSNPPPVGEGGARDKQTDREGRQPERGRKQGGRAREAQLLVYTTHGKHFSQSGSILLHSLKPWPPPKMKPRHAPRPCPAMPPCP